MTRRRHDNLNKEELIIEVLIRECETVGQQINTFILANQKTIGLGLAVLSAGLVYGLKEQIKEVLLFLPIAAFGILFYGIRIITETMCLGGYKHHLEETINRILGKNILLWESFIAPNLLHGSVTKFLYFIYALFF